ncbi:hypothetical protein J4403_02450 [Candidatus Woesearchaeota archaeon]|nr:hypothetical protein [Candidatus Woesearchaeota archaeon]
MNIEEEYKSLKEKYSNLPKYKDINDEFEIGALKEERIVLLPRTILRIMLSNVSNYISMIEPAINMTSGSLHTMIEAKHISDENKKEMFKHYKDLSKLIHEGIYAEMGDEKETINFIIKLWKSWKELKQKQKNYLKEIISAWSAEDDFEKQRETGYTG